MWSGFCGMTNLNSDSGSAFFFLLWPWVKVCIRVQYHRGGSNELFAGVRKDFKVEDSIEIGFQGEQGFAE